MTDFNIGDEVIFKNHRLQLGDKVVFTDKFTILSGRISDICKENNQKYYLIKVIDSDFSVVTYGVNSNYVIRTVSSLDKLEFMK